MESLVGLFFICFLASSLYPLGSEAFVIAFLGFGYHWGVVWIVATLGNTLGALTTYGIGYFGNSYLLGFFKRAQEKLHRYANGIQRFGFFYAFFSFLPVVGDVFAFGLGVFKYPLTKAVLFIALGKGVRYLVLILAYFEINEILGL